MKPLAHHLNDAQLMALVLNDETVAVPAGHLADCDECTAHLEQLRRLLDEAAALPVPERDSAYATRVWNQLEPSLDRLPAPHPRSVWGWLAPRTSSRQWLMAGALCSLLLAAFLAGRLTHTPPPTTNVVVSNAATQQLLAMVLSDHLDQVQAVLLQVSHASGDADLDSSRRSARDLIDANRLYRQTAAQAGDTGITGVLDALEPVLLEIAHSPAQLSHSQLTALREEIDGAGVLFEVRVLEARLRQQTSASARPANAKS